MMLLKCGPLLSKGPQNTERQKQVFLLRDKEETIMERKRSRTIGIVMLVLAVVFVIFALNHPEMSFPWSNTVTYLLYGVYLVAMVVFLAAPFKKNK